MGDGNERDSRGEANDVPESLWKVGASTDGSRDAASAWLDDACGISLASFVSFKALFEWSMKYQDGTSSSTSGSVAAPLSASDRQWLEEALAAGMVDLSKQLVEIKESLEAELSADDADGDIEKKERLLDELLDLVESIDQAKDLSTIGGLGTLLRVIDGGVPSLQWRAAEVIGTCAQNNEEVQASFFRDGVMPKVWGLLGSTDATCRLKALLAVSCLLRGSAEVHRWWSENGGVERMLEMIHDNTDDRRMVRKCLQILTYVAANPTVQDRGQLERLSGEIEKVLVEVVGTSEDADVEIAALELGKHMGLQSLFQNVPSGMIEALQVYLARMDVTMHNKQEDWVCVEENVVGGKGLLKILSEYEAPATSTGPPLAMQLVAIVESDGPNENDS